MLAQYIDPLTVSIDDEEHQSTITELTTLGKVIKHGLQPDSPELLRRYLLLGDAYTKRKPELAYSIYFLLFNTLLETASDMTMQTHWRQVCMNHIYRPLFAMQKISGSQQEKLHVRELRRQLATRKFF